MAAWYEQDGTTQYRATYGSLSAWQRERDLAARLGWSTRSRNPRPNKQGVIVINYYRSASAEARARVEHAMTHLASTAHAVPQQERAVAEALRQVRRDLHAARTDMTLDPVALESELLRSAQRLVRERQALQEVRRRRVDALSRAEQAHAHAHTVRGAKVDDLPGVDISERGQLVSMNSQIDSLRQAARAFEEAQAALVTAVKEWQQAIGRRWDSSHRRAQLEEKVAAGRASAPAAVESVPASKPGSAPATSSASAVVFVAVVESDGTSPSAAASESAATARAKGIAAGVSLLGRWRAWQLRRMERQLTDEGARLEQLEGVVTAQRQAVIAALQARDATVARVGS